MITIFQRQKVQLACQQMRPMLLRVACAWCHDPYLAEDLTQDCLVKAMKNYQQLNDVTKIRAWLMQILSNCWRDYLRRRHEHDDIDTLVVSLPDTAQLGVTQSELVLHVQHAIAQLPLAQRQVVTLVDLYESSYQEVADILDIPVGTVMSRLSRARKALTQLLAAHHPGLNVTPINHRR